MPTLLATPSAWACRRNRAVPNKGQLGTAAAVCRSVIHEGGMHRPLLVLQSGVGVRRRVPFRAQLADVFSGGTTAWVHTAAPASTSTPSGRPLAKAFSTFFRAEFSSKAWTINLASISTTQDRFCFGMLQVYRPCRFAASPGRDKTWRPCAEPVETYAAIPPTARGGREMSD
jgi:hypothetical protein